MRPSHHYRLTHGLEPHWDTDTTVWKDPLWDADSVICLASELQLVPYEDGLADPALVPDGLFGESVTVIGDEEHKAFGVQGAFSQPVVTETGSGCCWGHVA